MSPRTALEALLADLYDAQSAAFGDNWRRYHHLRISERGAIRAMWQAVTVEGERDRTAVAEVAGAHLRTWSRNWNREDWLEFHRPRLEQFADRLIAAHRHRAAVTS